MYQIAIKAGALAAAIAWATPAQAQYVVGAPIVVPGNNTIVTLEFLSYEAAYMGELSFLGSGTDLLVTQSVSDTGEPGLGQQTFINKLGLPGAPIALEGVYSEGDVLHFAYRVFEPADAADVLRTDDAATSTHFAWDAQAGLLHVEDLRPGHPWYDADYNDIIVRVSFSTVPGPAGAALFGLAAMIGRRRRVA